MADLPEGRVRLIVLGGYLGSGKTTWLRHQLHAGRFGNAQVIVNEAAETPVDDALLGQARRLEVLAGGCVCCVAKAELVARLRGFCDRRSRAGSGEERLDEIVLETSGLADPGPIVEAIRSDPLLVHHIVVGEIVVTVDAVHALSQLAGEPLGRRQIETADRLVVTKVDQVDVDALRRLLATLSGLNPGAVVAGAEKGVELSLPAFDGVRPQPILEPSDGTNRPAIFPARLTLDETVDWTAFTVWLSALLHARGDDVVRVKGAVRTPAGRLLLQSVRRIVQAPEILPEQGLAAGREDDTIVVIGRGYRAEDLRRSLRYFAGAGRD